MPVIVEEIVDSDQHGEIEKDEQVGLPLAQLEQPEEADKNDREFGHEREKREWDEIVDPAGDGLGEDSHAGDLEYDRAEGPEVGVVIREAIQTAMIPAGTWIASFLSDMITAILAVSLPPN